MSDNFSLYAMIAQCMYIGMTVIKIGSGTEAKIQLLQNMVMLRIKLKGMTRAVTW